MSISEAVHELLGKGSRKILRLQALGVISYVLFGPGLLGLTLLKLGLEPPAGWILRILGAISTILLFLAVGETLGKLRNYRAIENALREDPWDGIRVTLDDAPFRGVRIPKVWIRLPREPKGVYPLSERDAALVMEYFRKEIPPS